MPCRQWEIASGVMGLIEAGEGAGLTIAVAEVPVYVEAQRASILVPHDHRHISQIRMGPRFRGSGL